MSKNSIDDQLMGDIVREALRRRLNWDWEIPKDLTPGGEYADVILRALELEEQGHPNNCFKDLWKSVPHFFQHHDKGIALYFVRNHSMDPDDCPCLLDRAFMKQQFEKDFRLDWRHLPTELRDDAEFARSLETLSSFELAWQLFTKFPQMRRDRAMWLKAVNAPFLPDFRFLRQVVERFAPTEILSDHEIMVGACAEEPRILEIVRLSLFLDHDFLLQSADRQGYSILVFLSHELQLRFPDVVHHAMRKGLDSPRIMRYWLDLVQNYELLAPQLWDSRDFVLHWFQLGLPFGSRGPFLQQLNLKKDKAIFLLVAKHCNPEFGLYSFQNASMKLRRDKKFMSKVLKIAPYLVEAAAPSLRHDFDFCLLALSGEEGVARAEIDRRRALRRGGRGAANDEYSSLGTFKTRLAENLHAHELFCTVVLPATSQPTDSGCTLAGLNQGTETSLAYKKRVADYLGVPVGKKLRLHRRAMRNLNRLLPDDNSDD